MTRTLTVQRESNFMGCLVPMTVTVDGREIGQVKNGSNAQFAVDDNAHRIGLSLKAFKPAFSNIPANSNNITFVASVQFGFPCNSLTLRQGVGKPAYSKGGQRNEPNDYRVVGNPAYGKGVQRNELDDYREGGARYTPMIVPAGGIRSLEKHEFDEWVISNAAAGVIIGNLDIGNKPLVEYAQSIGKTVRAVQVQMSIREGSVDLVIGGYAARDCSLASRILSVPDCMAFDWLMSDNNELRTCLSATHNLRHLRNLILTQVARRRPNAVLRGNTLCVFG